MNLECVTIDDGVEIDWIDPVISLDEHSDMWLIDNGYCTYRVDKRPNREIIVRGRVESY